MKYVAVTTAHNEEELLHHTIESVLNQTIKPELYVVVDDNSNDETPEIIKKYPVYLHSIKAERLPHTFLNAQRAFMSGVDVTCAYDWDYLAKIDADSEVPPEYFENLLNFMERNPTCGICSGIMEGGKMWVYRSCNGAILYRRKCWDQIGGYYPIKAWDTHFIFRAYMYGWYSVALKKIRYMEHRTSKRQKLIEWYHTGFARHFQGMSILHTLGAGIAHFRQKPFILGGLVMFLTHFFCHIGKIRKPFNKTYYDFARMFSSWEIVIRIRYLLSNRSLYR